MRKRTNVFVHLGIAVVLAAAASPALAQNGSGPKEPADSVGVEAAPNDTVHLRGEVDRLRDIVEKQQQAIDELRSRMEKLEPVANTAPRSADSTAPASGAAVPAVAKDSQTPTAADARTAQIDELLKRWGKLRLAGDISLRSESFFKQGFDGPAANTRNRFRVRVRLKLSGEVSDHFDWGLRLASGSFDNPQSTQQSFTDFYTRKPIALDQAYLRFTSTSGPASVELVGGKFDPIWQHTGLTFDPDLETEGFTERVAFSTKGATNGVLQKVELSAWELPFKERSVGADAVILGGQILTDWKLSKTWGASLSGAFHDFEQIDLVPPATNVSPTLVNAGIEYGTTNAVVLNPFTQLLEYRSEYRVIDAIGELRYSGFGDLWPVLARLDWIHNTSAYNNQRDGGQLELSVGRRREKGDLAFDYLFWKVEREAFPSVFMESEVVLQTNSLSHAARVNYMINKAVQFDVRYLWHRRLDTLSPVNRWQNHLQFDVMYRF